MRKRGETTTTYLKDERFKRGGQRSGWEDLPADLTIQTKDRKENQTPCKVREWERIPDKMSTLRMQSEEKKTKQFSQAVKIWHWESEKNNLPCILLKWPTHSIRFSVSPFSLFVSFMSGLQKGNRVRELLFVMTYNAFPLVLKIHVYGTHIHYELSELTARWCFIVHYKSLVTLLAMELILFVLFSNRPTLMWVVWRGTANVCWLSFWNLYTM